MFWQSSMSFARFVALLSVLSMVLSPQMLLAGEFAKTTTYTTSRPAPSANTPRDIALSEGGVLVGQLVDAQGAAVALSPVSLLIGGKEIARVQSDRDGNFKVSSLQGGVYQVVSKGHQGVYRFWTPQTAPPAAKQSLTVVNRPDVFRGQFGAGTGNPFTHVGQWMAEHPLMTAGFAAAAIAIPIAVAESDDDDPPATP